MFVLLSLQVLLLLPLDLNGSTSYLSAYGHVLFNTIYLFMFILEGVSSKTDPSDGEDKTLALIQLDNSMSRGKWL